MLGAHQFHDLAVDQGLCLRGAGQRGVAAQVLVGDRLHRDHVKLIAHAVAGDHSPGQACCLFNIVGSSCCDRSELHFLSGSAARQRRNLVFDLLPAHQVVVALFLDLHSVAQGTGCAGDDRDLLHGGTVGLHGGHQGVSDLVIGDNELLFVRQDGVLFLVSGDDDLYALLHIGLGGKFSAVAHCAQGSFIDDIGQFRAGSACSHAGDLAEVHIRADLNLFGVDFEDIDSSLEIGEFHGDAPVKTAGSGQSGIQGFGPVGRRQNDHSQVLLEAVHLCQQLVQRLLALIIAAQSASVPLFANRVDLIDKDDAGCFFLSLIEEVAHFRSAHAHEHLHEFRAGHGKEGDIGFSCDRFGQHGLARSGRSDQQNALGHCRADFLVFSGIVQILHDLHEILLGFLFARDIGKADAFCRFYIDLGIALAHAEHHRGGSASRAVHQPLIEIISDSAENRDRQNPVNEEGRHRRRLGNDIASEFRSRLIQSLYQTVIRHVACTVGLAILVCKKDVVGPEFHFLDLLVFRHGHEGPVVHFLNLRPLDRRHDKRVDDHHEEDDQQAVVHH